MDLTAQQWLNHVLDAVYTRKWNVLSELEIAIKQPLADRYNWDRLERFYVDVLFQGVRPDVAQQITSRDITPFRQGVHTVFETAVIHAANDPNIEAFYFEYFYDGTDSCTGDVFLCTQYRSLAEDQRGEWAAEFNGIITGPSVCEYLGYDNRDKLNLVMQTIADAYIDARFLSIVGRVLDDLKTVLLPTGFARHNRPLVRILPRQMDEKFF